MKQVLHLTRAELRRLRWWPLGWLVLQVPGLLALYATNQEYRTEAYSSTAHYSAIFGLVWAYFLTVEVWSSIDPRRQDRFWQTRPIAPAVLAASHMLSLVVMLWLIPNLLSLSFWVFSGTPVADWTGAAMHIGRENGIGMLVGLLVGVLDPWISRHRTRVLHGILGLVACLAAFFAFDLGFSVLQGRHAVYPASGSLWWPMQVVVVLVASWLVLSRRRGLAAFSVVGLGVAVPLLAAWLLPPPIPAEHRPEEASRVLGVPLTFTSAPSASTLGVRLGIHQGTAGEHDFTTHGIWGFVEQGDCVLPAIPSFRQSSQADGTADKSPAAGVLSGSFDLHSRGRSPTAPKSLPDSSRSFRLCTVLEVSEKCTETLFEGEIDPLNAPKTATALPQGWQMRLVLRHPYRNIVFIRPFAPASVDGEDTFSCRVTFSSPDGSSVRPLMPSGIKRTEITVFGVKWRKYSQLATFENLRPLDPEPVKGVMFQVTRTRPVGRVFVDAVVQPEAAKVQSPQEHVIGK